MQRLAMNLGVALGGVVGGLIASVSRPATFTILFAVDSVTFLAYALVLSRLRVPPLHAGRARGSWVAVARDRTFVSVTALNAVFMAATMALMVELLPAFAKNVAGVSEREIGVIFALESLGIVLFQLPVAKVVEGRRRMRTLALMGLVWSASLSV